MSFFKDAFAAISGFKTYIVIAVFLACVFVEKALGFDVPAFDVGPDWVDAVLAALGLGALRDAISKASGK